MPDDVLVLLPNQDTVLRDLRELLPSLRASVMTAWGRMEDNPSKNRLIYRTTTTANCLVDHMACEARALLGENPRVYFRSDEETWLVVDQRYDIRFKKLSRDGVPTNTETHRQRRITSQSPLPNFNQVRLNVGWGEDKEGNPQVLVSFNTGFGVVGWCVELRQDGVYSLAGQSILPFDGGLPRYQPPFDPFDLGNAKQEEPARRVRPRRIPQPEQEERRRVRPAGQRDTDAEARDAATAPPARKTDE